MKLIRLKMRINSKISLKTSYDVFVIYERYEYLMIYEANAKII